ncbi:MAG: cyclic lactone autoinducer peptide [Clostridiaceae bacterium]
MKEKTLKKVASIGEKLFNKVAHSTSASACSFAFYQPKEPKSLRKD